MDYKKIGQISQEYLDEVIETGNIIVHFEPDDEGWESQAKLDWDFVDRNGRPQQLIKMGNLMCHSIGGPYEWTNDIYSYDLSLANPKVDDLNPFDNPNVAPRWAVLVEPKVDYKTKWGNKRVTTAWDGVLFRNGAEFHSERRWNEHDAYVAIMEKKNQLCDHPCSVNVRDWVKNELVGRKIWYDNQPAVIDRHIDGARFSVVPAEGTKFEAQGHWKEESDFDWDYEDGTSVDLFCDKIYWFRDME